MSEKTENEMIRDVADEMLAVSNDSEYVTNLLIEMCENETAEEMLHDLQIAKDQAESILSAIRDQIQRLQVVFANNATTATTGA